MPNISASPSEIASIGSETSRPGARTPAPYCVAAASNSASGLNENRARTRSASSNGPREKQHGLDDLDPGGRDHAAEEHVRQHHRADDHHGGFVAQSKQQTDEVAGADHLSDQVERDDGQAACRGGHAHGRLAQPERDHIGEREAAEIAQRLGDEAHHDRPADEKADRVDQPVETRQGDQPRDAQKAGRAHVVAGQRQAVLRGGNRTARRVEVLGAAGAPRREPGDDQRQADEDRKARHRDEVGLSGLRHYRLRCWALRTAAHRGVIVPVGPAHVDDDDGPRHDDDQHAEQNAHAQSGRQHLSEQRLVEGDEQDEADIDDGHRRREQHREPPARGGQLSEASLQRRTWGQMIVQS